MKDVRAFPHMMMHRTARSTVGRIFLTGFNYYNRRLGTEYTTGPMSIPVVKLTLYAPRPYLRSSGGSSSSDSDSRTHMNQHWNIRDLVMELLQIGIFDLNATEKTLKKYQSPLKLLFWDGKKFGFM